MTTSENLQAIDVADVSRPELPHPIARFVAGAARASREIMQSLRYLRLAAASACARAELARVPEPRRITDGSAFVNDYNNARHSVMGCLYALALDHLARLMPRRQNGVALDLCCGPGHFTTLLAQHLGFGAVTGIDLSEPMLRAARANARIADMAERLSFVRGDVRRLDTFAHASFDLVSFTNGAHHFGDIGEVADVLLSAERICRPDGVIFLFDPARMKNAALTRRFVAVAGEDYLRRGLPHFHQDFSDSMFASWRPFELAQAVPRNSARRWLQIVPPGLATFQMLIGIPDDQRQVFARHGLERDVLRRLVPPGAEADWRLLQWGFRAARMREVGNR
jgi:ubiquinone/menaquinone biosynthesis C-methylase UbiE